MPLLVVGRKRASTVGTNASTEEKSEEITIKPPLPARKLEEYDESRLEAAMLYTKQALSSGRNLSPLGERAIRLYQSAVAMCLHLLKVEDRDEELEEILQKDIALIRTHEEAAEYRACLVVTKSSTAEDMRVQLESLVRMGFYARYGDVLADACRRLKSKAESEKVPGWRTISGKYWTQVNQKFDHRTASLPGLQIWEA